MISTVIEDSIIPPQYIASLETWAALKLKARNIREKVAHSLRADSRYKALAVMLELADRFDEAADEISTARINAPVDYSRLPF